MSSTQSVLATLWEMPQENWRPFAAMLTEQQVRLGNAQKIGDPMGAFSTRKQEDCPPCLHIFQAFSVYFVEAQWFY